MATATDRQLSDEAKAQAAAMSPEERQAVIDDEVRSQLTRLLREQKFKEYGSEETVTLSVPIVKRLLCHNARTKSGALPTDDDIIRFIMLCRARGLNPYVGDAWIIGFDSERDGPQFNLVTSLQALAKRAEMSQQYDGMKSGVVVVNTESGQRSYRLGTLVFPGETLVGGWAKVFRKDRKEPEFVTVQLGTYDQKRSRWNKDKAGMILKCARAAGYRAAFPAQVPGMYVAEEMDTDPSLPRSEPTANRGKLTLEDLPGTDQGHEGGDVTGSHADPDDSEASPPALCDICGGNNGDHDQTCPNNVAKSDWLLIYKESLDKIKHITGVKSFMKEEIQASNLSAEEFEELTEYAEARMETIRGERDG